MDFRQSRNRGMPKKWIDNQYVKNGIYNYVEEFDDIITQFDARAMPAVGQVCRPLSYFELDEDGKIGYVYKCLKCALWAMMQIEIYKSKINYMKLIKEIVAEGGDANTNAIVAGALFGTFLGFDTLYGQVEKEIDAMPHTDWLMKKINKYIWKNDDTWNANGRI